MEGSQMTGINLRVATLKNAKLKNCNLRGATLAGTDLEVRTSSGFGENDLIPILSLRLQTRGFLQDRFTLELCSFVEVEKAY